MRNKFGFYDTWQNTQQKRQQQMRLEEMGFKMDMEAAASVENCLMTNGLAKCTEKNSSKIYIFKRCSIVKRIVLRIMVIKYSLKMFISKILNALVLYGILW